jgi:hypothetical protein
MRALNIDHGLQATGALLFDDLRLVNAQEAVARVSYRQTTARRSCSSRWSWATRNWVGNNDYCSSVTRQGPFGMVNR